MPRAWFMIVVGKTFALPKTVDVSAAAPLKDILFIDIETTGLSTSNSGLYLIGAAYHRAMEWHLRQWFADSLSAEQEILQDFSAFVREFTTVVTYNGESFELPFLEKCAAQYGIDSGLSGLKSFDLYRRIRPLKKLLGLENVKLQTVEAFLNIPRSDDTAGKDLIPVYKTFLETKDESLYQTLLAHNEEDVKVLPQLMPMLGYIDIFHSSWTLAGYSLNREKDLLTAVIDCSVGIPVAFSYQTPLYTISVRANQIIAEIPVREGELRYFFDDYHDYDYLPEEDRAVHRKLSQYVDKDHRVRATAETCYTRKQGIFLPLIREDAMFDTFRENFRSTELYTEYIDNPDFLLSYFRLLLTGDPSIRDVSAEARGENSSEESSREPDPIPEDSSKEQESDLSPEAEGAESSETSGSIPKEDRDGHSGGSDPV
jgi:hypothetical protein